MAIRSEFSGPAGNATTRATPLPLGVATLGAGGATSAPATDLAPGRAMGTGRRSVRDSESRQLGLLRLLGFVVLLVPAAIAGLTGWRWCPWPPGPEGHGSILSEARMAADTYVPQAFVGL